MQIGKLVLAGLLNWSGADASAEADPNSGLIDMVGHSFKSPLTFGMMNRFSIHTCLSIRQWT
jgi:hypothetical protein